MIKKRVRRRAKHTTKVTIKRGVIYLPRWFIGTTVCVLTERQYNHIQTIIKQLKRKVSAVRKAVYEYSRT